MYVQKLLITIQNNLSRSPLSGCIEIFDVQFFSLLINLVIPFLSTLQIDCCSLRFVIEGLQMISLQLRCKKLRLNVPISAFLILKLLSMFCNSLVAGVAQIWRLLCMQILSSPCVTPHMASPLNSTMPPRWNFPDHVATPEGGEALVGN